jgi:hypothetical protein
MNCREKTFGETNRKNRFIAALVLFLLFAVFAPLGTARAAVVEADPDLQLVMGDLYALALAMRLYYDDTHETKCPDLDRLTPYFQTPLPVSWADDYRTAVINGRWWAGRRVPEFSRARKFLRENASSLGLYDKESDSAWMGGAFVWIEAAVFDEQEKNVKNAKNNPVTPIFRAAPEEGGARLFVSSPGTEYYWWSDLLFTLAARSAALEKFGAPEARALSIPSAPKERPETFTASPVSPPAGFSVRSDEEEMKPIEMGGVILNPFPRSRDSRRSRTKRQPPQKALPL